MRVSDWSEPLRLFTAILPTRGEQQAVAALRRHWGLPPGRLRPRAERLHLTLQFVAQWPASRLADRQRALSGLHFEPFDVILDRSERWRTRGGELVVLRPRDDAALLALHAATEALARQAGVPAEDRAWRPHVTVLRGALPLAGMGPVNPVPWRVDAVSLVCSELAARLPSYRVLGRYPAAGGGAGGGKTTGTPR